MSILTFNTCDGFTITWSKQVGISKQIVDKVADKEGVEPDELKPLYTAVEPDALNQLFQSQQQSGIVVFPYMGYEVFVTSDEKIEIE